MNDGRLENPADAIGYCEAVLALLPKMYPGPTGRDFGWTIGKLHDFLVRTFQPEPDDCPPAGIPRLVRLPVERPWPAERRSGEDRRRYDNRTGLPVGADGDKLYGRRAGDRL